MQNKKTQKENVKTDSDILRINKYISEKGVCSRREADALIEQKRVTINNRVATLGSEVKAGDTVRIDGNPIKMRDPIVYIALNKPEGITCTTDTSIYGNIISFMDYPKRIFPIGRLDKDSEGLIFLTNDGDMVNKILRAGNNHEKEYIVTVNKPMSQDFISKISNGVRILGTITKKCQVEKISKDTFRIVLTEGMNRQIRRMCEVFGYEVTKLTRVRIMNVKLGDLPNGMWRYLTEKEISIINSLVTDSIKTEEASKQIKNKKLPIKK